MIMKTKFFLLLFLAAIITSCNSDNAEDKYDLILEQFEGEYELESMEWTPEGGRTMAVDINNDGKASNDLLEEIIIMHSGVKLNRTKFFPNYGEKTGTFTVKIPVLDYYQTSDIHDVNVSPSNQCFLKANINEDGSMTSEVFDHLEWPDEDRIGLRTFGGVSIVSATPQRIELNVERYMVYDFRTSQRMIGSVFVILERYNGEQ